jgi:hypothetical protein
MPVSACGLSLRLAAKHYASRGTPNTLFRQCGLIAKVHTTVFGVAKVFIILECDTFDRDLRTSIGIRWYRIKSAIPGIMRY